MPKRRTRRVETVACWNMKVGRGAAALDGLAGLIADHQPDVILLQEGMNYVARLRLRFGRRWRVYSGAPGTVRANCPIMVRRSIPRGRIRGKGWGLVKNVTPWYYRGKDRNVKHEGRVWTWVRVDGIRFLSIHRATEALGHNAQAGREEADNIEEWFDNHDGPHLAAGDWNNLWSDKRTEAPAQIARRVKGQLVIPPDARIDYAITRDLDVTAVRDGKYGSDHHAVIYRLA